MKMTTYVKRLILLLLMIPLSISAFAPEVKTIYIPKGDPVDPWLSVWQAVKYIESRNNPTVINTTEGAFGCGQIRQAKLNDFNKSTGHNYSLIECLDETISYEVFKWHCAGYKVLDLAVKRWNGRGVRSEAYWHKIQKQLTKK